MAVSLQGAGLVFGSVEHACSQLCPVLATLRAGAQGAKARPPSGSSGWCRKGLTLVHELLHGLD